ncbi:MAG: succinylglutamate-semialdehyde dehydrogenase [Waddliaceae bacterium]
MQSYNPATGKLLWESQEASLDEINLAITRAKRAFKQWSSLTFDERREFIERFRERLQHSKEDLALIISEEVGKPLWESKTEVDAMIGKVAISIDAYIERTGTVKRGVSLTSHKPHGVLAIIGPYNFPAHLPNGHMIPALLAGNAVILKPSEKTPKVGDALLDLWKQVTALPDGLVQVLQGGASVGSTLIKDADGVLFTGSHSVGKQIHQTLSAHPEKILALEMGGNNPLIAWDISNLKAAAYIILQSAYLTSGQRCTCARRLIIPDDSRGTKLLDLLIPMLKQVKVGPYTNQPEPFMGPLISEKAAINVIEAQKRGIILLECKREGAFVTPGLIDVTDHARVDEEIFGPLLQVIRVKNFQDAVEEANNTRYGLSAGILTDSKEQYETFFKEVRAGVINWNCPLTGASSNAPFGGIGKSGNHRPTAYYAADYCSYPVASLENETLSLPENYLPGVQL